MEIQVKYSTMIVNDMEESVRFYRDVMGFTVDSTYHLTPKGAPEGDITLMRAKGDTMIELIKDHVNETGFYSIGMEVDDMDTAMRELKEKGAKILAEPMPTSVGSCAFLEDPNGVRICIIHHF
ncbi:VOC family protein [Ruminococcaceae bacterium OttesenSCG-928-I18]|nr:VOC family protein [Ruminococcaceae bacterium OttesenSCG-928-I18]